jgi:HSP20 family molecular chaperone IbpA
MMDPNIGPTTPDRVRGHGDEDMLADAIATAARPMPVPVNMYEADDAVVIVGAMPGVMADDVEITIERDRVWLRAGLRTLAPKPYLLHEWHYGPYERLVEIPAGFEGEPVAHFGNGQVALRIGRGGRRTEPVVVLPGSG